MGSQNRKKEKDSRNTLGSGSTGLDDELIEWSQG
jgi:hypothetical protein